MTPCLLFGDINVRPSEYNFGHSVDLLLVNLFAQTVLVVTENITIDNICLKGFIQAYCLCPLLPNLGRSLRGWIRVMRITLALGQPFVSRLVL